MAVVKMSYSEYKNEWDHCKTVRDSYNREDKTVDVKIPDYILQLKDVIPSDQIESYRSYLIEIDHREFANTFKILEMFAEDLHGTKVSDWEMQDEWVEKAIDIATRAW